MTENSFRQARLSERSALLQRVKALLEGDQRVVAAWLHGSLGRGDGDLWSDLDVWVVVSDERIEEISATKREYIADVGKPIIVVDASNAPRGGAFLSVVYGGQQGGPQHVDWTWQPESSATVPNGVRVLFNRETIPQAPPAKEVSAEERIARARHQLGYFWMMVPIVAKYIARRRTWDVLELLQMVERTVDEVAWLVDGSANRTELSARSEIAPLSRPREQLALLRQLAGEIESVTLCEEALQGAVSKEALSEVYLLLDQVEVTLPR
jgi:predicted nucleotidyltransferase